jgi:hypothetical protein
MAGESFLLSSPGFRSDELDPLSASSIEGLFEVDRHIREDKVEHVLLHLFEQRSDLSKDMPHEAIPNRLIVYRILGGREGQSHSEAAIS